MKKTLIALMALAGVVSAADWTGAQADAWLTEVLQDRNGSAYTLTFTISEDWARTGNGGATILTLNTNGWRICEQDGQYVGLSENSSGPSDSFASRTDSTVNYIDMDVCKETQNPETGEITKSADYNGWIYDSGTGLSGLQGITISVYGSTSSSTISVTSADNSRTITLQRDGFITPGGLNFGYDNVAFFSNVQVEYNHATYIIPEPATATLSLLALAGLAARRRRR